MSEPKTPGEFARYISGNVRMQDGVTIPTYWLAQQIAARDEQIRQQERARGDALERASHHLAGRLTEVERERDQLRKHYDAAGGEHNLLALLDMYMSRSLEERARGDALERACHHLAGRLTEVERGRDQLRAQVAVEKRAWARVHEALGIKPDGLAGILGTIEDLKERVERGEHRK